MLRFATCLVAVALVCVSAAADISSHYRGKRIGELLGANPGSISRAGTVYRWRGGVEGTGWPTINPGPGGGLRDFQVECRLEIRTNGAGVIQSITITRDTIGQWNFSRCTEVIN
jgi:hypothetical protein